MAGDERLVGEALPYQRDRDGDHLVDRVQFAHVVASRELGLTMYLYDSFHATPSFASRGTGSAVTVPRCTRLAWRKELCGVPDCWCADDAAGQHAGPRGPALPVRVEETPDGNGRIERVAP